VDHPCKCKGQDLGLWKHGESPHHSSGSRKICQRCGGTGTIPARPKQIGDLVRFYRWTGRLDHCSHGGGRGSRNY